MVLLTIVTTWNPHTVYFDHDIANPNYIRLLSASIYNSWHNLKKKKNKKKTGRLTINDNKKIHVHTSFYQGSILWKTYPTHLKTRTKRRLE